MEPPEEIMKKRNRSSVIQMLLVLLTLVVTIPAFSEDKSPVRITPQELSVSAGLKEREDAVAAKEKAMAAKEKELAALSKEVDEKFSRVNALQEEIKGQL